MSFLLLSGHKFWPVLPAASICQSLAASFCSAILGKKLWKKNIAKGTKIIYNKIHQRNYVGNFRFLAAAAQNLFHILFTQICARYCWASSTASDPAPVTPHSNSCESQLHFNAISKVIPLHCQLPWNSTY